MRLPPERPGSARPSRPVRASGRPRPAPEPRDPLERGAGRPLAVAPRDSVAPRLLVPRRSGRPPVRAPPDLVPPDLVAPDRAPPARASGRPRPPLGGRPAPLLPRESGLPEVRGGLSRAASRRGGRGGSSTTGPVVGVRHATRERDDARLERRASSIERTGGVLLSQGVYPQVPSARAGLTAVFGMGTGVSPPPWPPDHLSVSAVSENSIASTNVRFTRCMCDQALGRLVPVG